MKAHRGLAALWAGIVLLGFLGALLYRGLERRGDFNLTAAMVYGCRSCDSTEVSMALRPFFGCPLGRIEPAQVRSALQDLGGIEDARVWREWPDGIGLEIRIARPVLILAMGRWRSAVSDRGENLPETFLSDTLPLFEVEGGADPSVLREIVSWASGGVPREVEYFRIDGRCLEAVIGGRTLLLGEGSFSRRLATFSQAEASGLLDSEWDQVDLRYGGQVVLRRNGSRGGAS